MWNENAVKMLHQKMQKNPKFRKHSIMPKHYNEQEEVCSEIF